MCTAVLQSVAIPIIKYLQPKFQSYNLAYQAKLEK